MQNHELVNHPKVIRAWAFFDWANSAYALVITAAIFPAYFIQVTDDYISLAGIEFSNSALYAFSISLSYFIIAILSPILSGIADYSGRRKFFLKFFTGLGALSCMTMFFFTGMETLWIGTAGFILAMIGFSGGLVFYNAYLPEIASRDRTDMVSAKGYAFGYFGSVILLILNLVLIQFPGWFGLNEGSMPARLGFVLVGLWWWGFAQITFRWMPPDQHLVKAEKLLKKGFQELVSVWQQVRRIPSIVRFLAAFFFYSAGVQTVIFLAATFAEKELQFDTAKLIATILLLQIVGIGGAYLFAVVARKWGNKSSLLIMLSIWILICVIGYIVSTDLQFYAVAAMVGLVMGGIQAISRSTYAKLLRDDIEEHTSFFSFYDVLEKLAIILGTFLFGFIDLWLGGMRNSILALGTLFLIGILILRFTDLSTPHKT